LGVHSLHDGPEIFLPVSHTAETAEANGGDWLRLRFSFSYESA